MIEEISIWLLPVYLYVMVINKNIDILVLLKYEKFEDTKGVIRSRKSKKGRQLCNGRQKMDKKTNNNIKNTDNYWYVHSRKNGKPNTCN